MSKLEMPDLPWFRVEEEIQRLGKAGMLEWICHLRPTYPPWEGTEGIPFTTTLRNKFVRGAPAFSKSSVIALLCRPDLTVGTAITELGNLKAEEDWILGCRGLSRD